MFASAAVALATAAASSAVGVGLDEYHVAPYRAHVRPGTIRFNVSNLGEDVHDFAVRDARGRVLARMPPLASGERGTLRVRLPRRGLYTLFCTIADHEQRGMRAHVRVVRARR